MLHEALAQDKMAGGDTAWIITATALVLFMTLPGLALVYAGLVQSKIDVAQAILIRTGETGVEAL